MARHTLAAERDARIRGDEAERKLIYAFAKQFHKNDKAAMEEHALLRKIVYDNHDEFTEARRNVIRDRNFLGRFKWLFTGK